MGDLAAPLAPAPRRPNWQAQTLHIRHLVILDGGRVIGVLSVRDLLLAGQRIELNGGDWDVLRDPLTFTLHERRRLQRYLLNLREEVDDPARYLDLLGGLCATPANAQ